MGAAIHEIGHALGFESGIDIMAAILPSPLGSGGDPDSFFTYSVLDLFRYSSDTAELPDSFVPDVSLPVPGFDIERYFSVDGGASLIATFSTGTALAGDGAMASHWKDDATPTPFIGVMDPTLGDGVPLTDMFLTDPSTDLTAFDVMGYDLVPEPNSILLAMLGAILCATFRRSSNSNRR